ncbi:hypothetical protein MJO29_013313 [Puccinia striiformis f. sp. tritici]|uniref:F-box domain-containing protein n=1 Tax=Puccinia striiformis f. sp. tritici PST-78 TaxID=1165861 RepID=A0A0L0V5Q9_9BASI|nr:hypothetical protein MJO29_013313 [Puccinia striiformis f. sp. tritici]KNE94511.1 hypothetical protein PSTG_12157 [Puccinia striiformis f. sp. tritici PST-78]
MISHQLGAAPSSSKKALICYPASLDRRLQLSPSTMSACSRLPSELLVEIFNWLPPLSHSPDRLSVCCVCRSWLGPAQIVLWRSLWLRSPGSVSSLAAIVGQRPGLAKLPRALHFSTGDNEYLAELDPDAVFTAMERLVNLEQFHVLVNYCMGDLYDSLCEELMGSPIKHIVLGADEGIGRSHVQASMRHEQLQYLELLRLGDLGDLRSLELEWVFSESLVELVLIQPELPGDAFRFLLSHVKGTLKRLRIDFGHLVAANAEEDTNNADEGTTGITEEDLETALIESGADLQHLDLRWPYSTRPFLNEAVKALYSLEDLCISGGICDAGLLDLSCQSNLERISFDLRIGTEPPKSLLRLIEPGARRSNLTTYHLRTFFDDPCWEQSVIKMVEMRDQDQEIPIKDWDKACIEKWRDLSKKLGESGIQLTADFL